MTRLAIAALIILGGGYAWLAVQPGSRSSEVHYVGLPAVSAELRPVQFSTEFMGMHTLSPARHWPAVTFGSVRPAGTSWGALEPSKGQYDWHSLDSWVAEAQKHRVQLDYVFVNTPLWASTRPDEPCINKRVGCAAPPNLNDWEEFVRTLVTRYRGRISSYELWNEPNGAGFWTGSAQDMVELASRAYPIIKSIDPAAIVTTPAVSSSGWPLQHDAWLDQYFAAGGGKYADVVAWHGYAGRNDRPALPAEGLTRQIQGLRAVLERYGLSQLPIWNTEGGWGKDAQLPDENEQASFLVKWYLINFTYGISRAYWYQWDNPDWGTLWREGSGVNAAGQAYRQVYGWLDGATGASACKSQSSSSLWTCDIQKGKVHYRVAWSVSGKTPFADMAKVVTSTEVGGSARVPEGQPVVVGSRPILFELKDTLETKGDPGPAR
jgi:hypothetical protein